MMGTSVGSSTVKGQRGFPIPTPPSRLGRYSAVRHLLADLEQETRAALKTLYGFSEITSRKRREAQSWSSVRKGTDPKFLNLAPLMAFEKGDTDKARDFFTGRKRKVNARIIHKASDVMHIHNSKEVVGFQLVRRTSSPVRGLGWDHGFREVGSWIPVVGVLGPGRCGHGPGEAWSWARGGVVMGPGRRGHGSGEAWSWVQGGGVMGPGRWGHGSGEAGSWVRGGGVLSREVSSLLLVQ